MLHPYYSMNQPPPRSTLFPYTTLFRSQDSSGSARAGGSGHQAVACRGGGAATGRSYSRRRDRKSTRLNSSHITISYAVFCLKKKNKRGHPGAVRTELADDGGEFYRASS